MSGGEVRGLPSGWEHVPLGEIAEVVRGVSFPSSAKEATPGPDTVLCLRTANVQQELTWDDVLNIPKALVRSTECWLQPGDIVMSMANSLELVGKVAFAENPPPRVTFGAFLSVIRAKGSNPAYLFHLMRSQAVQEAMRRTASRTVNIANLSLRGLLPLELPLAPANEQKRIVAKIEALQAHSDAAKEALDAIPALVAQFRQSVLAAAFRGDLTKKWREEHPDVEPASKLLERIRAERRLRWQEANPRKKYVEPEPVDTEGLPELPEGWCWATLDEAAWSVRNGVSRTPEGSSGVPVLRISAVRPQLLDGTDIRHLPGQVEDYDGYFVAEGDLLFTRYNGNSELVGACAVVPHLESATAYPDKLIRVRLLNRVASSDFVAAAVQVGPSRIHIRSRSKSAAGQVGISGGDLKLTPLPMAPLAEQQVVAAVIRHQFATLAAVSVARHDTVNRLASLNQSILAKAFRGELVPQDPNDEPASVLLDRIRQERENGGSRPARKRKP
jgi:type I restriction enzyme S subunit